MALSLSPALQAALQNPERAVVALFTFEFGTGIYGLWTGLGNVSHNGLLYQAGGSVLELSDIEANADGSVGEMTIGLSAAPEKGISDDVLIRLYDEDWHLRPVTVQIGLLDPATGAIVGVQTLFRGRIEEAPFTEGPDGTRIEARCVSRSIDLSIPGNLYRNEATQRLFDATDTSLIGIGTLGGATKRDLKWGQG